MADRVVLPAHVVQELQRFLGHRVVRGDLGLAVGSDRLHASTAGVRGGGQFPSTGVSLGHLHVARDTGNLLRDDLRVLAHLVPRCRRLVRVEARLLEDGAVVRQPHGIRPVRDAVDLVALLCDGEDVLVELIRIRQLADLSGDVRQLARLEQRLGVGERHVEHVRQRAAGELRGERRTRPLVFLGLDHDVGVRLLERLHPGVERRECGLVAAGDQAGYGDVHLAVAGAAARARAAGQQADSGERDRRDRGDRSW